MGVTCGTILIVPLILPDTYLLIIRSERLVPQLRQLFWHKAVTGERMAAIAANKPNSGTLGGIHRYHFRVNLNDRFLLFRMSG